MLLCAVLLVSGCLCCGPPSGPGVEPKDSLKDDWVLPTTTTLAPGTDQVCEQVISMCNQKTSVQERDYCRKSLGC